MAVAGGAGPRRTSRSQLYCWLRFHCVRAQSEHDLLIIIVAKNTQPTSCHSRRFSGRSAVALGTFTLLRKPPPPPKFLTFPDPSSAPRRHRLASLASPWHSPFPCVPSCFCKVVACLMGDPGGRGGDGIWLQSPHSPGSHHGPGTCDHPSRRLGHPSGSLPCLPSTLR